MTFSSNWFYDLGGKHNFQTIVKPNINNIKNYLEIGVFEGQATLYMFENMIDNMGIADVIDPFEKSNSEAIGNSNKFEKNLSKYLNRINIYKGFSNDILPTLKLTYDLIYIDGSHRAMDVYNDAINSFKLLKSGGIMVFDDYLWYLIRLQSPNEAERLNIPLPGINQFVEEYFDKIELLTKPLLLKNENLTLRHNWSSEYINNILSQPIYTAKKNDINWQFIIKKI